MMQRITLCFIFVLSTCALLAQTAQTVTVTGTVTDLVNKSPVEFVTVNIFGTTIAEETDINGKFSIKVPIAKRTNLRFIRTGYKEVLALVNRPRAGSNPVVNVEMASIESEVEAIVRSSRLDDGGMIREDVVELKLLPSTTGNFESVLPHIALGVSGGTGGELSSQYNVRGGNYDENLVYVNDFEIYRPQLIRAGQQEGLTFPNIDLIRDLSFSSGGFEARYGDKLSSVLDIKYKRPDSIRASVGMSFLGGSAHIEGSFKVDSSGYRKLRYLVGARYKTTRYLLGSLDLEGEYTPNFTDVQAYLTYDINRDWQVGLIGNYNRSEYQFIPASRTTAVGLIDFALELFTVFEGQEVDDFTTSMGGVSFTYLPDRDRNPYFLKFLASRFQSDENERFDIIGFYRLGQIESDLGSDGFGEVVSVLGTGTQQEFVRNSLQSTVTNVEHKGGFELQKDHDSWDETSSHFFQWSVKYQQEIINDELNEWERLDSAGYSLPYDPTNVLLREVLKTKNNLNSNRFSAYVQDTYTSRIDSLRELKISAGVRASYWDLNQELIVSPRVQLLYKPLNTKRDISYRLAAGLYYQSPFYRELRDIKGVVDRNVQSQKSLHIVGGLTYDFNLGKRSKKKFRFIAEAYYKKLWDLISYDIENVRIRYSGANDATGYVAGLDIRVNGEFVPGAESWINLSFLRARENLTDVQHLEREKGQAEGQEVDNVSRPTDQFMTLSMFFQDYLPKNENFKMHLNLTVGTGLPYGFPENNKVYRNTYRFPSYHRVDIGFSVMLFDRARSKRRATHPLRFCRRTWVSLEVFNLMKVSNVASNTWVKTIYNTQYAIPNFLTSRRINLRLKMDF
ncbi:MAG: carboxypeptidase-like regulatory domain-containing protein [Saprospiraceae bacterium]